jgi:two-component system chemotaxis response regulator CheY
VLETFYEVAMSGKPWVGKTVVIIDDSQQVRESLEVAFKAAGMRVAGLAKNGVEGLALVNQHNPEVASIDIIMPEMDGIECMKMIRSKHPSIHCMFVTWLATEVSIAQSLAAFVPAHAFQAKPFTNVDIENRLKLLYFPPQAISLTRGSVADDSAEDLAGLGIKVS